MPSEPTLEPLRRWALRGAWVLATLSTTPAHATPDAAMDPISRFLVDGGFVDTKPVAKAPPSAPSLVDQVRDRASELVLSAMHFLGVRYRRGGNSVHDGFDCSGFTRHVFERSLGLVLPRRVDDQASAANLSPVKRDDLKPGDLVFFNTLKRTFSHVGIYVGDGKFIHAPRTGALVRLEDMRQGYWSKRYTGARRAHPTGETLALSPQPAAPLRTEPDSREAP
jgi:cell wall-associated NlpC family hydrolase